MPPSRGFSLIEAIVALAIVGVMIMATSSLLQSVIVSGREVGDRDLALKIAHNEVELLRAAGYSALPASGPFTNALLSNLNTGAGVLAVTVVNTKTKRVEVTVSWKGAGGPMRSLSLTTLVAQNSGLK